MRIRIRRTDMAQKEWYFGEPEEPKNKVFKNYDRYMEEYRQRIHEIFKDRVKAGRPEPAVRE